MTLPKNAAVLDKLSVWEVLDGVGLPATLGLTVPVVDLPLTDTHPWWACECPTCTLKRDEVAPEEAEKPAIGRAGLASHAENLIDDQDALHITRWMLAGKRKGQQQ